MATTERRGRRGDGTIYWDKSKKSYRGEISLGYFPNGDRNRPVVYGRTITEVKDKFKQLRQDADANVDPSNKYTVQQAVEAFLKSLEGSRDVSEEALKRLRSYAKNHVIPGLGAAKVKGPKALTADQIEDWLKGRAPVLSTRMLESCLSLLRRSLAHAKRRKKLAENVAEQDIVIPKGRKGRPRRAASFETVQRLLQASREETHGVWVRPYLVVSIAVGPRTEEVRRLEWADVFLDPVTLADGTVMPPHIRWVKSVREGDEMKTLKSYRATELAPVVVSVLRWWKGYQRESRKKSDHPYQDIKLVFGTGDDKLRSHGNVRRRVYQLCDKRKIPRMTPAEARKTFVSIQSALGTDEETIADVVGHATTSTTRRIYRDELRPVISGGAQTMGKWLEEQTQKNDEIEAEKTSLGHLLGHHAPHRFIRWGAFLLVVDTGIEPVTSPV